MGINLSKKKKAVIGGLIGAAVAAGGVAVAAVPANAYQVEDTWQMTSQSIVASPGQTVLGGDHGWFSTTHLFKTPMPGSGMSLEGTKQAEVVFEAPAGVTFQPGAKIGLWKAPVSSQKACTVTAKKVTCKTGDLNYKETAPTTSRGGLTLDVYLPVKIDSNVPKGEIRTVTQKWQFLNYEGTTWTLYPESPLYTFRVN